MFSKLASFLVLAADEPTTPPAAAQRGDGGWGTMLVPLIIIFAVMYIFIIAPQRKKEKQRRQMLEAITKGDDVVTIGGICGKVWQIKDQEVVIQVADNVRMTFSRGAIARVEKGKGEGSPRE